MEDEFGRWRLAPEVREFVAEVRCTVTEGECTVTPGGELDEWLRWADSYAERIDPVATVRAQVARIVAKRQASESIAGDPHRPHGETADDNDEPSE
jgi:hypothetical protein